MVTLRTNDFNILFYLVSLDKECTTTEMAKAIFGKEIKDTYDLIKKDSYIRSWLKKFERMGIVKKVKNGNKTYYTINRENVMVGKQLFVNWETKQIYELDVLGLKVPEIGWIFVQLPQHLALRQ